MQARKNRSFGRQLEHFYRDESGQTVLEFVLMLFVAIAAVSVLKSSIQEFTTRIWLLLAKKIAAPCFETKFCPPDEDFNL